MNYSWSENDIYYLKTLGIDVEAFDSALFRLQKATQIMVSEFISYLSDVAKVCIDAFKQLVDICEEFTESLDIEYKPKPRYAFVAKLGSYKTPKLTYRYFHKEKKRGRGED